MKTLNNDFDTVEFEAVSIEEAQKLRVVAPKRKAEGHDPYNSSTRLPRLNENDIDAWFLNHGA